MRKVYPNHMVAHIWANRSQDEARSGNGNLFFRGDTIYSYGAHFPIARHMERDGKRVILFTTRYYSNTTSDHKRCVRNSIAGSVIKCKDVRSSAYRSNEVPHYCNWQDFTKRLDALILKAARARINVGWHLSNARELVENANAYAEFFGLSMSMSLPENMDELLADARKRDAADNARLAEEYRAAKDRQERAEAEYRKKAEETLQKWLAGEADYINGSYLNDVFLRVKGDTLETTKGTSVPLDHAVKAFYLVLNCREVGREYQRNGHSIHVGHFTVNHIDTGGNLTAGCHFIKWAEIERIAKSLGLI